MKYQIINFILYKELQFINLYIHISIAEVEKQLQGGGEIPLLSYKKSQTGSTGNIHGLVLVSDQISSSGITQGNI